MRGETLIPLSVLELLNSGRGTIQFYANVVHAALCPRHLVLGKKLHHHGKEDKVAAICVTERIPMNAAATHCVEAVRLFVRCFSVKCEVPPAEKKRKADDACLYLIHICAQELYSQPKPPRSVRWIEMHQSHFTRMNKLKLEGVLLPPPTGENSRDSLSLGSQEQ